MRLSIMTERRGEKSINIIENYVNCQNLCQPKWTLDLIFKKLFTVIIKCCLGVGVYIN